MKVGYSRISSPEDPLCIEWVALLMLYDDYGAAIREAPPPRGQTPAQMPV